MDLIMDKDGSCKGVTALCMEDGTIHRFQVGSVIGRFSKRCMHLRVTHPLKHLGQGVEYFAMDLIMDKALQDGAYN